jgi:hypothetical protein
MSVFPRVFRVEMGRFDEQEVLMLRALAEAAIDAAATGRHPRGALSERELLRLPL